MLLYFILFALIAIILYAYSVLRYYDVWKRIKIPVIIYGLIHGISLITGAFLLLPWAGLAPDWLLLIGNVYIVLYSAVMLMTPIFCFFRGIVRFLGKRLGWKGRVYRFVNHPVKLILCFLLLSVLAGVYGFIHERSVQKTEYKIEADKDAGKDAMSVVFLTDLRVGNRMTQSELSGLIGRINQQKPDLVLFGGNLIGKGVSEQTAREILDKLQKLSAGEGVYLTEGVEDAKRLTQMAGEIEQRGLHLLRDEFVVLTNGIQLAGCREAGDKERRSLSYTLSVADPKRPAILLSYNEPEDTIPKEKIDVVLTGGAGIKYGWQKKGTINFIRTSGVRSAMPFGKYIVPSEFIQFSLTIPSD